MTSSRAIRSVRWAAPVGTGCLLAALFAVMCSAGVARAASTPTFSVTNFAAGLGPTWVEPIDVTGDGLLDLVVANGGDDSVSVLAGDGRGNFTPAGAFPTGGDSPYALDVADLTGDGDLDIAVANRTSATVTILKGDGTGGFTFLRSIVVGTEAIDVRAMDLDDDGDLDLVATSMWTPSYLDGTLYLLYNNGLGVFKTVDLWLPYSGCTVMGVGDLNEDGHVDVVVGHSNTTKESVLLNDGLGPQVDAAGWPIANLVASSELEVGPNPQGAVLADFDGDTHQDVCVTSRYPNRANIYLGDGTGAFTGPASYAVGPYAKVPTAADLNGDGVLDIVTANYGNDALINSTISVLPGVGDGTFEAQSTVLVGDKPHSVAVADFNVDGWPDLVVPDWASDEVSVLLNTTPYASDTTAPATTSSADTAWHRTSVTVTLDPSDAQSGVAYTRYRVDGGAWKTGTSFSVSGDGAHGIDFYSVDMAGNKESTKSAQVKIDGAPAVTTSSADGAWHRTAVTVTFAPVDALSGVAATSSRVDGAAWQTGTSRSVSGDGVHDVEFYSTDTAGNTESAKSAQVKIDGTAPSVTLTTPQDGASYVQGSVVTCDWTSSDAASGVASEAVTVGGAPIAKGARLDTLDPGTYSFALTVTDAAGNQRTVTAGFTIPVPDPSSLTPSALKANVTWGGYAVLKATLKDTATNTALGGKSVRVQSSPTGLATSWSPVTPDPGQSATGEYTAAVQPKALTYYRFSFVGDGAHASVVSETIVVRVRPAVGKPQAPSAVKAGARFRVTGTLKPRFTSGAKTVKIKVYRYKSRKWFFVRQYSATNANSGSYSKYVLKLRLSVAGKYRFSAYTSTTAAWAAATTGVSRTLVVK